MPGLVGLEHGSGGDRRGRSDNRWGHDRRRGGHANCPPRAAHFAWDQRPQGPSEGSVADVRYVLKCWDAQHRTLAVRTKLLNFAEA
jgi:hypothetical protein